MYDGQSLKIIDMGSALREGSPTYRGDSMIMKFRSDLNFDSDTLHAMLAQEDTIIQEMQSLGLQRWQIGGLKSRFAILEELSLVDNPTVATLRDLANPFG